jgi:hypothetical protein
MALPGDFQIVTPKTIDGTLISALLYTVPGPAPAVIMSHGVSPEPRPQSERVGDVLADKSDSSTASKK